MDKPVTYIVPGVPVSEAFGRAFSRGCLGAVTDSNKLHRGAFAFFALPELLGLLKQARSEGRDWYYGDHGYFKHDRFSENGYFRVTRNAFQMDGRNAKERATLADMERLETLGVKIQPWRPHNLTGHILICPPSARYAERQGFDGALWVKNIRKRIRQYSARPFRIRPRDNCELGPSLESDLRDSWCFVCHQSNIAVEALCLGYPGFCTGFCAGRSMCHADLSRIESPFYPPDRFDWAALLAGNQWTLDEIETGAAWVHFARG